VEANNGASLIPQHDLRAADAALLFRFKARSLRFARPACLARRIPFSAAT
jgi:hypothetical protein